MTGVPDCNYPEFNRVARLIRRCVSRWDGGPHEVINPAELDNGDRTRSYSYYLRRDIECLLGADAIAVLAYWRESTGAALEVMIARALGIPVLDAYTLEPTKDESILDEALHLVTGNRRNDYGPAYYDYSRVVKAFYAFTNHKLSVADGVLFMLCVKMAREGHKHKRDNLVDIAGYANVLNEVHEFIGTKMELLNVNE